MGSALKPKPPLISPRRSVNVYSALHNVTYQIKALNTLSNLPFARRAVLIRRCYVNAASYSALRLGLSRVLWIHNAKDPQRPRSGPRNCLLPHPKGHYP